MKHINTETLILQGRTENYLLLNGKILMKEAYIPTPVPMFYRELLFDTENVNPLITGYTRKMIPHVHMSPIDFETSLFNNKKPDFIDILTTPTEFFQNVYPENIFLRPGLEEIYYTLDLQPIPEVFTTTEHTIINSQYYNLESVKTILKDSPFLLENRLSLPSKIKEEYLPIYIEESINSKYLKFSVIPPTNIMKKAEELCISNNQHVSKRNISNYLFNPAYLNDWLGIRKYSK